MNWSRQKSYLTGMTGTGTDVINGTSELTDTNAFNSTIDTTGKNYKNAHIGGMNGTIMLSRQQYVNPNNILHNNMPENILNTQTFDNKIFIDSVLKDFSKHPEPYKFIVKFNGIQPTTEKIIVSIDDHEFSYDKFLKGDTTLVIHKEFKNVKYVNINALILPTHVDYETCQDGSYRKIGEHIGKKNKYLIMKIEELNNGRSYSNMKNLGKDSFIMKLDDISGINNEFWIPIYGNVCYFDSRLETIDRLTVEICDERGRRLCTTLDGVNHDFFRDYRKTIDYAIILKKQNTPTSRKQLCDMLNKLKSLDMIVNCIAPELHLTFNTIEPQIDTDYNFRI